MMALNLLGIRPGFETSRNSFARPLSRQICFRGKDQITDASLLDYRSLAPSLSNTEVSAYEEVENRWGQILKDITPNRIGELIRRIEELPRVKIKSVDKLRSAENSAGNIHQEGFLRPNIVIEFLKKTLESDKQQSLIILAHELLHTLHAKNEITKFKLTGMPKVNVAYKNLYHNVIGERVGIGGIFLGAKTKVVGNDGMVLNDYLLKGKTPEEIKMVASLALTDEFWEDEFFSPKVHEAIDALNKEELYDLKKLLLSECVAYTLANRYRAKSPDQLMDITRANGFKKAAKIVSETIKERAS